MEPISNQTQTESLQKTEAVNPDPSPWNTFFKQFNSFEQKQFLKNMQHQFSQMIYRHMRKSKEAAQKLKESHR